MVYIIISLFKLDDNFIYIWDMIKKKSSYIYIIYIKKVKAGKMWKIVKHKFLVFFLLFFYFKLGEVDQSVNSQVNIYDTGNKP